MASVLTIVMYHYVRDLAHSRFPEIKGLSAQLFAEQIGYIKKHYNVISAADLMNAIADGAPLPARALLLTFDDGYLDHFTEVFPVLDREGMPGCFFPPARCIVESKVLDVNKIHFVLATSPNKAKLLEQISARIDENAKRFGIPPAAVYRKRLAKPNRLDTAEVVFCKMALQHDLPLELRSTIIDELFTAHVTTDEAAFARELYMSAEQLMTLQRHGMYIGSHGYDHFWLNTLPRDKQQYEVDESLRFLESLGADVQRWMMCYPYGAYNDSLLSVLKSRHCVAALTTEVGLADVSKANPLTLPRLDTNDLPRDSQATVAEWTIKAIDAV